jgi:hypothetical protein
VDKYRREDLILIFYARICFAVMCQLGVTASIGFAQTTGTISPSAGSDVSSPEPPPGGCMPIGVTANGDIVFPFACKDLIETHRKEQVASEPRQAPVPSGSIAAIPEKNADEATAGSSARPQQQTGPENAAPEKSQSGLAAAAPDKNAVDITGSSSTGPQPQTGSESLERESIRNGSAAAAPQKDAIESTGSSSAKPHKQRGGRESSAPEKKEDDSRSRTGQGDVPGCTHFRTYNPRSESYRDYRGRRQPCRS